MKVKKKKYVSRCFWYREIAGSLSLVSVLPEHPIYWMMIQYSSKVVSKPKESPIGLRPEFTSHHRCTKILFVGRPGRLPRSPSREKLVQLMEYFIAICQRAPVSHSCRPGNTYKLDDWKRNRALISRYWRCLEWCHNSIQWAVALRLSLANRYRNYTRYQSLIWTMKENQSTNVWAVKN